MYIKIIFIILWTFPLLGSMAKMKDDALINYAKTREALTLEQIDAMLEQGAIHTDLTDTLCNGGAALFPHVNILACGDQVAAVAIAALKACAKSGKNLVIIGVLHSLTDQVKDARQNGHRAIFGPEDKLCEQEFSTDNFVFLLKHASRKTGIPLPKITIQYPFLISGYPETFPRIEDAIVVATSDLVHQGAAYGQNASSYESAYQIVAENLRILASGNLLAYRQYCLDTLSDSADVGQWLMYLLGPLEAHILDFRLVDVSHLFVGDPKPSYVAATLVALKKK